MFIINSWTLPEKPDSFTNGDFAPPRDAHPSRPRCFCRVAFPARVSARMGHRAKVPLPPSTPSPPCQILLLSADRALFHLLQARTWQPPTAASKKKGTTTARKCLFFLLRPLASQPAQGAAREDFLLMHRENHNKSEPACSPPRCLCRCEGLSRKKNPFTSPGAGSRAGTFPL